MADTSNLSNYLKDVADAIREKKGTEAQIPAANFDTEILSIESGIDISDATATVDDVMSPKTFYSNGGKLVGAIQNHQTPIGEVIDISTSQIDILEKYDLAMNNQNIVCKYNSSGYLAFYSFDTTTKTLTEIYTTDLSNVYFTMSDCYYDTNNTSYDILLVTKDAGSDTSERQNFEVYKLNISTESSFEKIDTITVESQYYGRLYSTVFNGVWYPFLFTSEYNTFSATEAALTCHIYSVNYVFGGSFTYTTKNSVNANVGRIGTNYRYPISCNITTIEDNKHIVAISSCSTDSYSNLSRCNLIVLSSDFSITYLSQYDVFWPESGNTYWGGICAIGQYIVNIYTTDSSSLSYVVKVFKYDGNNNELSLIYTTDLVIPFSYFGGAPNRHLTFYVIGNYGICIFSRSTLCYGFTFNIINGEFNIIDTLFEEGTEYAYLAVRNQHPDNTLFLKTYTLMINVDGYRLDNITVANTKLYNTNDADMITSDLLIGKTGYNLDGKTVGTMPNNGALEITPSAEDQTIPEGYTSGGKVSGDVDLKPENIKAGVTIFGVEGIVEVGPITQEEYEECLALSYQILGTEPPVKGHIYGIKRLRSSIDTAWERTDDNVGKIANATKDGTEVQNDFDNLYPWSDIISFDFDSNSQSIIAYYGDDNFTFSPSDTNINVFTKIPQFWYKRWIDEDDYEHIQIADYAAEGFLESKEFAVARYSYEGSTSSPRSCSGLAPLATSGQNYQTGAKSLGNNIYLFDWRALGAIQFLYLVEYANNNSQDTLGKGISSGSMSNSGQLDSLGMKSGCLNNDAAHSVMYRGIEDIFGNVYQLIDGVNINNDQAYVCTDPTKYEFEKYDGDYAQVGYVNSSSNGRISKLGYDENYPLLMLPIECSGVSDTTGFTDYYYRGGNKGAYRFRW